ncbi:ATP-dependent DNA helicase [Phytohalomonas tamaricis]|uniref:ATP-dependent DNA helicase n=1 Tax=Phytohalomonas tamaricis TaxID=2081032 RepID=UPI000D0B6CFC|nr:ATP-dependent DNA helicase [Phytohalomonas tamaricis]
MKYRVAVRALCEFTAKAGDLDLCFTPSPSAQEGIAGHGLVASRRHADYQTEITLEGAYQHLVVRGRADGYDPVLNQLEEVKTYRGDLNLMPENHRQLHWAQAKIYGWLLCCKLELPEVRLALVYFNIVTQQETVISEVFSPNLLEQFFEHKCSFFLGWAEQELAHQSARNQALRELRFPFGEFRVGQRQLAEAAYKAVSTGRCLMLQAPTGIGKTMGTLFPLLKAFPSQQLDKLFFLAAKTPGRRLALDALKQLLSNAHAEHEPSLPLRVLELTARDKACEHPDRACHGDSCPLAQGFYDRLPAAREAALECRMLDHHALRTVALEHNVCPYYLSQEMTRWSDVIVGDYNYYFDVSAMLYAMTRINQWRVSVLVDEAHNMIERGRKMYTAELDQVGFNYLRRIAPSALKKPLDRLSRQWNMLNKEQASSYGAYDEAPAKFLLVLQHTASAITDYLTEHPIGIDSILQRFYFDALRFGQIAELFDANFLFDITKSEGNEDKKRKGQSTSMLCLRNVVPAPFMKLKFEASRATVLFSATLSPGHFYKNLLGLPDGTPWIEVDTPFSHEQLEVHVNRQISTRFQHRRASLEPIAALVARQYEKSPGNYLTFFSSFDYLQQVVEVFSARYPDISIWIQERHMDEHARQAFLDQFTSDGRGVAFAVLGGAFGEGVDLPGKRLVGAFIATLGLPQMNAVNEQIKKRMQSLFGDGYRYTYLYPGMQKVVQAAGRVIRTQQDKGAVFLIDDRFTHAEIQYLLPKWWNIRRE